MKKINNLTASGEKIQTIFFRSIIWPVILLSSPVCFRKSDTEALKVVSSEHKNRMSMFFFLYIYLGAAV
jgi:hypothetical protein